MCNIPVPGSRRPYGQDGLVDFEEEQYTPETDPYFMEDRKQPLFFEMGSCDLDVSWIFDSVHLFTFRICFIFALLIFSDACFLTDVLMLEPGVVCELSWTLKYYINF